MRNALVISARLTQGQSAIAMTDSSPTIFQPNRLRMRLNNSSRVAVRATRCCPNHLMRSQGPNLTVGALVDGSDDVNFGSTVKRRGVEEPVDGSFGVADLAGEPAFEVPFGEFLRGRLRGVEPRERGEREMEGEKRTKAANRLVVPFAHSPGAWCAASLPQPWWGAVERLGFAPASAKRTMEHSDRSMQSPIK